jgi:hypothetical protein
MLVQLRTIFTVFPFKVVLDDVCYAVAVGQNYSESVSGWIE